MVVLDMVRVYGGDASAGVEAVRIDVDGVKRATGLGGEPGPGEGAPAVAMPAAGALVAEGSRLDNNGRLRPKFGEAPERGSHRLAATRLWKLFPLDRDRSAHQVHLIPTG